MAARHAGFGAVATASETVVNAVIAAYFESAGPYFIPLPTPMTVNALQVALGGVLELLTPVVELHVDPQDHIHLNLGLRGWVTSRVGAGPEERRLLLLSGTVASAVLARVDESSQRISVAIDPSQIVVAPLSAQVLVGPALPNAVRQALESPLLAAIVTALVNTLPLLTISPPMLRSHISHTQSLSLPFIIASNWFTIELVVSRIVIRPVEAGLTVAVDFAGLTHGDAQSLVNLSAVPGKGKLYKHTITVNSEPLPMTPAQMEKCQKDPSKCDQKIVPILTSKGPKPGSSIASVLNLSVVSAIVSQQISPQIWKTPISTNPDVSLISVNAYYTTFQKPLRGLEDGLALGFHVRVEEGPWFGVDGTLFLQAYLQEADGSTEFVCAIPEGWRVYVGRVDIDLPVWVDVAAILAPVYLGVAMPMLAPIAAVSALALETGIVPGLVEGAENQVQGSLNAESRPFPEPWSRPLPGLMTPPWNGAITQVSFSPEGIDVAVRTGPQLEQLPRAVMAPKAWSAANRNPIALSVAVRADLARLADHLRVAWTVRRIDTNAIVASDDRAYTDPLGNGPSIQHHSEALYYVDAFDVRCSVLLTIGAQTGEIWSDEVTITVTDNLDRRHPYVQWGPHTAYFKNAGTGGHWWAATRTSRIHRTAISARCQMLKRAAQRSLAKQSSSTKFAPMTYFDQLPFPVNDLNGERGPLCEYCFFGGPDKVVPYPTNDWF